MLAFLPAVALIAVLAGAWWYALTFKVKYHSFHNKTCVVVGAANGIGKCVAQLLCKQAKHLILIDICDLSLLSKELSVTESARITCIQCDISNLQQVRNQIQFKEPVHLLVLCAGVLSGKSVMDTTCEEFDHVLSTNVSSQFHLVKEALRARTQDDGAAASSELAVVSVSSLMGLIAGAKLSDYCASKFALVGMFEALRLEYFYDSKVSFGVVCPWVVDTGMFAGIFDRMWYIKLCFPFLTPQQVAKEVVLAGERARAITVVPFWFTPLAYCVRLLPEFLYFRVLILLGGRSGMDTFVGKREKRE